MTHHDDCSAPARRVFITGGTSGLGREIARHFHRLEADVGIFDLHVPVDAAETIGSGMSSSGRICAFQGDVRKEADLARAVEAFSGSDGHIDVVVCVAGIVRPGRLEDMPLDQFNAVMDTNLLGSLLTFRAALPALRRRPGGARGAKVVFISSINATHPKQGMGAYSLSKVAINNMTRVLAREHAAEGIQINAIAPGTIDTPMVSNLMSTLAGAGQVKLYGEAPIGRVGVPADILKPLELLCAEDETFMTGAIITLDGGRSAAE